MFIVVEYYTADESDRICLQYDYQFSSANIVGAFDTREPAVFWAYERFDFVSTSRSFFEDQPVAFRNYELVIWNVPTNWCIDDGWDACKMIWSQTFDRLTNQVDLVPIEG